MQNKKRLTRQETQLLIMAIVGLICLFFFSYLPMFGILLSVKQGNRQLNILNAIFKTDWTFNNYINLMKDDKFWSVMRNTVGLNGISLLINFPAPIILALLMFVLWHRL